MHATGVMRDDEQRQAGRSRPAGAKPWDDDDAPPMHIGIRLLWSVIAGYAAAVIMIALLSAAMPTLLSWLGQPVVDEPTWALDAHTTHLLGVAGAISNVLLALRRQETGVPRARKTKDRPHDGWIG